MTPTLAEILASSLPRTERVRRAAEAIRQARGFHWVGVYEVSGNMIRALGWTGEAAPAFPSFPSTHGLNGAALAGREPIVVQDVSGDSRYLTTFGETRAEAIFPIRDPAGVIVGTLDVESDRVNAFSSEDQDYLAQCAELLRALW